MRREGIALALAMVLPTAMAYVYFVVLGATTEGQSNTALQVVYPAAKMIQFSLPVVFLRLFGWPKRISPIMSAGRGCQLGITFGLLVGATIFAAMKLMEDSVLVDVPVRVTQKVIEFGVATPARFIGLAAFLSFVHSLAEEYYWRWFVHARLRQWLSFRPAAALSSVAFAMHHLFVMDFYLPGRFWSAALPFTLCIALGGMVWAWIYERSGSLMSAWISHILVDAAIMVVGYRMVFCG